MDYDLSVKNKVVGLKQSQKAVTSGMAEAAFVARDAGEHIKGRFKGLCVTHSVKIIEVESMALLGEICGIEVNAAVAVLLNRATKD